MDECTQCGERHPERELVALWVGRHYYPRPDDQWVRWREDYAVRLCAACADPVWASMRDAIRPLAWGASEHADNAYSVGADQGAPRLRPGEEP